MPKYRILKHSEYSNGKISIVPIRYEDRFKIMKWRNEQLFHLRQATILKKEDQEHYFNEILAKSFNEEQPSQILFSYLEETTCIGYGGLVHINWIDKNAEISFLINTELEKEYFEFHWQTYLGLIEQVGFNDLMLHKIYTYAFDVRPYLYPTLLNNNFLEEARLKEHCFFNGRYVDVVIHSKIKKN